MIKRADGKIAHLVVKAFNQGADRFSPHNYTKDKPLWLSPMASRALCRRGVVKQVKAEEPEESDDQGKGEGDQGDQGKEPGPSETKPAGPSETKGEDKEAESVDFGPVSLDGIARAEAALEGDNGTEIRSTLSDLVDYPTSASKKKNKADLKKWIKAARRKLQG